MASDRRSRDHAIVARPNATLIQEHNLFKMDTIGDAYIVAALLPPSGPGSTAAAGRACQDLEVK